MSGAVRYRATRTARQALPGAYLGGCLATGQLTAGQRWPQADREGMQ